MVYRVTVDYVTSTTVTVEADSAESARDAVYGHLKTEEGLDRMLRIVHENPNRHWSAFDVVKVREEPDVAEAEIPRRRNDVNGKITVLGAEDKRDIARRLYDIGSRLPEERITRGYCQESYLDGLWMAFMACGYNLEEFMELQDELYGLLDGLIDGDWE